MLFITKYELARVLGERAQQLEGNAKAYVDLDDTTLDSYLIAYKEFQEKKT